MTMPRYRKRIAPGRPDILGSDAHARSSTPPYAGAFFGRKSSLRNAPEPLRTKASAIMPSTGPQQKPGKSLPALIFFITSPLEDEYKRLALVEATGTSLTKLCR